MGSRPRYLGKPPAARKAPLVERNRPSDLRKGHHPTGHPACVPRPPEPTRLPGPCSIHTDAPRVAHLRVFVRWAPEQVGPFPGSVGRPGRGGGASAVAERETYRAWGPTRYLDLRDQDRDPGCHRWADRRDRRDRRRACLAARPRARSRGQDDPVHCRTAQDPPRCGQGEPSLSAAAHASTIPNRLSSVPSTSARPWKFTTAAESANAPSSDPLIALTTPTT